MDDSGPSFDPDVPEAPPDLVDPLPVNIPAAPLPDAFLSDSGMGLANDTVWPDILSDSTSGPWATTQGAASLLVQSSHFWDAVFSSTENATTFDDPTFTTAATSNDAIAIAALGLVTPPPTPPSPLSGSIQMVAVANTFGISPDNTPIVLQQFFDTVNSTGTLSLKLDTDERAKNAVWFVPDTPNRIAISFRFVVEDSGFVESLETFFKNHYGLLLGVRGIDPRMVFTTVFSYSQDPNDNSTLDVSATYTLAVSVKVGSFDATATFTHSGLNMVISGPPEGFPPGSSIIDQLSTAISAPSAPGGDSLPIPGRGGAFNEALSQVELWYISVERSIIGWKQATDDGPAEPEYGDTFWQIALIVKWRDATFGLTFDTRTTAFNGELLFRDSVSDTRAKRSYDYDWQTDIPLHLAATLQDRAVGIDLWNLLEASGDHPSLPSRVVEARASFRKGQDGSSSTFGISARAISSTGLLADSNSLVAPSGFLWDEIAVSGLVQSGQSGSIVDIQVSTAFSINPPPGSMVEPATLRVNMEYFSGGFWMLHGRVEDLSVALLYEYFSSDVKDSAIGVLGKLNVRDLNMLYTLQAGGPSSFLITATILLGELELDLTYQYVSGLLSSGSQSAATIAWDGDTSPSGVTAVQPDGNKSHWEFKASLGTKSRSSTVGSVINSISANAANTLPTFVTDIQLAPRSGSTDFVKLDLSGGDGENTIFIVWLTILEFSLTFVSISPGNGTTKRVLRISVDEIPLINDIPAIKELPQPFDRLLYLWVDDETQEGLSEDDVKSINASLTKRGMDINPIIWKSTSASGTPVVAAGHHFMVLDKSTVILDHRFDNTEPDPTSAALLASSESLALIEAADVANSEQDSAPTKGSIDKQLPFLSISAISLQYRKPSLVLSLDATVVLGPITFTVIGFEIDLNLSGIKLNDLRGLVNQLSASIRGLSVKVDNLPLLIAGVFIHEVINVPGISADSFKGGLALGFETWQLLAVGQYASVVPLSPQDGQSTPYKSVFVFAKLDGPLITLTFATVSGVRVGFGYNSLVRSPSVKELADFPLLSGRSESSGGNDPLQILQSMTEGSNGMAPWISMKQDSYWVAAGLTVTAFGILSVTAVLMLGFRDSGVVVSVLANGVAQMPPAVPSSATLFYVEVDMIAEVNTIEGYFTVQAALAPTSHVLVSSCRLTGGFALVNWFSPSVHAGDFVFTVGGFHRAYTPPAWYPVPERLGVSFTLGGMINVTGNVYFAITPKCVMGGGSLHLGLDVGPISAWLDVLLDVFIQFKPFHYTADLSVSVGCAVSIKVWFVHIRISVSVGAALHIEGPNPFGGFANVDFYVCSFTIHFGGSVKPPDPIPLQDFYDIVAEPGARTEDAPQRSTGAASTADLNASKIKLTVISGLLPPEKVASTGTPASTSSATTVWRVKPGTFSCTVGVDFAVSNATLVSVDNSGKILIPLFPPLSSEPPPRFFSKPMHLTNPIDSTLTITVWRLESNQRVIVPGFTGSMILKDVPVSLWGLYDRDQDPAGPSASPSELRNGTNPTMTLCLGVQLVAPIPTIFMGKIGAFYPAVAFGELLDSKPIPHLHDMQDELLAENAHGDETDAGVRWNDVKTDWQSAAETGKKILDDTIDAEGDQVSVGLISLLVERLGWDTPPPGAKPNNAPETPASSVEWNLQTKMPGRLVADFERTYPALPMYATAAN